MKVTLTEHLGLVPVIQAVRMSHDNHDRSDSCMAMVCLGCHHMHTDLKTTKCGCGSNVPLVLEFVVGNKDKELVERVGNKFKHKSVLEHIVCSFDIDGVSRALLQELARHRTASLTVKSTRYTLKELKDEPSFKTQVFPENETGYCYTYDRGRAELYLVFTGVTSVDDASIDALEKLRLVLVSGVSNDKAKYCLPESYKTRLQWTMDGRNLQSFLQLRSSKDALWEIRMLANALYDALPEDHKYLFSPYVYLEEVE